MQEPLTWQNLLLVLGGIKEKVKTQLQSMPAGGGAAGATQGDLGAENVKGGDDRVTEMILRLKQECESAQERVQAVESEIGRLKLSEGVAKVQVHPKVMAMVEKEMSQRAEAAQRSRRVEEEVQELLGVDGGWSHM